MIIAVALGVCGQCLALTAAGSRFHCTKPDHRDHTPGWTARHESFNAAAAKGDVDLVFLGDSISHRWEREGAATWKTYYGQRKAANFGIDSDQTKHLTWRIDNGNFDGIAPRLIVIMPGTNNGGHEFQQATKENKIRNV
jgi:hypothetical protein